MDINHPSNIPAVVETKFPHFIPSGGLESTSRLTLQSRCDEGNLWNKKLNPIQSLPQCQKRLSSFLRESVDPIFQQFPFSFNILLSFLVSTPSNPVQHFGSPCLYPLKQFKLSG